VSSLKVYTASKRLTAELTARIEKWGLREKLQLKQGTVIEVAPKQLLYSSGDHTVVFDYQLALPFLGDTPLLDLFPYVEVDEGAVPHICNGADIMRPGIVAFHGEFEAEGLVVIRDSRHRKGIAAGLAVLARQEAETLSKGKVVENRHWIGDMWWELNKTRQ
jgi:PUA domain protein